MPWREVCRSHGTPPGEPPPPPPGGGLPFGPFGIWATDTTIHTQGTSQFNSGQSPVTPGNIIERIDAAEALGYTLIFAMTGGSYRNWINDDGFFDFGPNYPTSMAGSKWANRMDTFNTAAIKARVASGYTDGVCIGASLLDEPANEKFGSPNPLTKATIDLMHDYARAIFPTLPFGINGRPDWRTHETYTKVDYALHGYSWRKPDGDVGNVTRYRDECLAQDAADGVATGFSMNVRAGGFKFLKSVPGSNQYIDCPTTGDPPLTGGPGTEEGDGSNCAMTGQQIEDYGSILAPAGQMMLLWQYSEEHFIRDDWQDAFDALGAVCALHPFTGLLRP